MTFPPLRGGALPMLLALAACGGSGPAATNETAAVNETATAPLPVNEATPEPTPALASGALMPFLGKHPSEPLEGVSFLGRPEVRQAVGALPDSAVRAFILGPSGPTTPIVLRDGRLLAWGCERHNCSDHNWAISILPDGSAPDICFFQKSDVEATWFHADGTKDSRPGPCPSE